MKIWNLTEIYVILRLVASIYCLFCLSLLHIVGAIRTKWQTSVGTKGAFPESGLPTSRSSVTGVRLIWLSSQAITWSRSDITCTLTVWHWQLLSSFALFNQIFDSHKIVPSHWQKWYYGCSRIKQEGRRRKFFLGCWLLSITATRRGCLRRWHKSEIWLHTAHLTHVYVHPAIFPTSSFDSPPR